MAHRAPAPLSFPWPDLHHERVRYLVQLPALDHYPLDSEQPLPYPVHGRHASLALDWPSTSRNLCERRSVHLNLGRLRHRRSCQERPVFKGTRPLFAYTADQGGSFAGKPEWLTGPVPASGIVTIRAVGKDAGIEDPTTFTVTPH